MLFGDDDRRQVERKREADELFTEFWKVYPKKVARIDAVRAWNKLRPDAALLDLMLKALEWQCAQWTDRQYIPNPASWLNGHRWEDEPPEAVAPKTMSKSTADVIRMMRSRP